MLTEIPAQAAFKQLSKTERGIGPSGAPRRHYRAIWISDVHLGTRGCNCALLLDFLDHCDSDTLYLVGDIIDGWRMKKRFYWPERHNAIVRRIMKKAKVGTRVVYIPGNHDEMFRQFTGMNFGGVEIRRAAFHTTADGRRLMVLHGDEFDAVMLAHRWLAFVGDALYHLLMGLNRWVNGVRRWFDLPTVGKSAQRPGSVIEVIVGTDEKLRLRVDQQEPAGDHQTDQKVAEGLAEQGFEAAVAVLGS